MNFFKSVFLFGFFCFLPLSIIAQSKKKQSKSDVYVRSRRQLEPIPFHFSGLGSMYMYGLKFGIDYPLRMVELRGFLGGFQGQRTFYEQYVSADIGMWHYNGAMESPFVSLEWTLRFINSKGFFWQISPIGVGANYVLTPFFDKNVQHKPVPESNKFYVTPSVSMGIGHDFAMRRAGKGRPLAIYIKGGASAMYPYKKSVYLFPTIEGGMAYRFSGITTFVKKIRRD